jgi:hypothetical protein
MLAGIYFDERRGGALDVYRDLPSAKRLSLRSFLKQLLESLELPKQKGAASDPDGVLSRGEHEWEPGCRVFWRVVLRPKKLIPSMTRIDAYRVEVLLILIDS